MTTRPTPGREALLQPQLARVTRLLRKAGEGDVTAVHQARVASRRLREILPILELDPGVSRKLGKRLRKVTRTLGPVRELDVLITLGRDWKEANPRERRALARVTENIQNERTHADSHEAVASAAKRLGRAARKLEKISRDLKDVDRTRSRRRAWQWALEARVARRAVALDEAMTEAGAVYLPERLHRVRIAVKKLRYAVELLLESRAGGNGALKALKRSQDTLGHLHDLEMLLKRTREEQGAGERSLRRDLDALVDLLERQCRSVHAQYLRLQPALKHTCEQFRSSPDNRVVRRRAG